MAAAARAHRVTFCPPSPMDAGNPRVTPRTGNSPEAASTTVHPSRFARPDGDCVRRHVYDRYIDVLADGRQPSLRFRRVTARVAALRSAGKRPAARHDPGPFCQSRPGPASASLEQIRRRLPAPAPDRVARYAREVTVALDSLFNRGHPLTRGLALDIVRADRRPRAARARRAPGRIVPEFRRPRLPQVWVPMGWPAHVRAGLLASAIWRRSHV